jgi:hypothetical protein
MIGRRDKTGKKIKLTHQNKERPTKFDGKLDFGRKYSFESMIRSRATKAKTNNFIYFIFDKRWRCKVHVEAKQKMRSEPSHMFTKFRVTVLPVVIKRLTQPKWDQLTECLYLQLIRNTNNYLRKYWLLLCAAYTYSRFSVFLPISRCQIMQSGKQEQTTEWPKFCNFSTKDVVWRRVIRSWTSLADYADLNMANCHIDSNIVCGMK